MVGTLIGGAALSAGTQVAGQVQGMASNMVGNLTGNITGGISSFVSNLVGGIFSGPTGAAGVNMENERKSGDSRFHNSKIGGKWNDFDHVLKTMNKGGLQAFGWSFGKTPSSASGNFKKAENAFFEVLKPFLDKVIAGQAQFPKSFDNDQVIMDYLMQNMPASTPIKNTPKPDVLGSVLSGASKATSVKNSKPSETTKKTGSIPWWLAIPFLI